MMRTKAGYILLDALVAAAMLAIVLAAVLPTLGLLNIKASRSSFQTEAAGVLTEGIEVAYNVLLSDWISLPASGAKYLVGIVGIGVDNKWSLTVTDCSGNACLVNGKFTRTIQVLPVCRDGSGLQTGCPGNVDLNSKNIYTRVEWSEPSGAKSLESKLLIYKY